MKGNKYLNYPEQVAYGIRLHRSIDLFTDQHDLVKESINILKPGYGRYAGIVSDVFFDHFLAANWNSFVYHPFCPRIKIRRYKINRSSGTHIQEP